MSENQYLEIIENKLDAVSEMVAQQSKSGVFFDGFTKEVLEKIHNKLDYISNFETNELISYLTEELIKNLEDRHNALQLRLDGFQGQLSNVQANLSDSLKSPEITQIFTKLSDSVLDFSRDLNAQTRFFNSTLENVQSEIGKINIDERLNEQTNRIKYEIDVYKNNLENLANDVNTSFNSVKNLIEANAPSQAIMALSGDISVLQKGLNDVVNSVLAMNNKQGELVQSISNIAVNADMQDIRLDVSAIVAEMQILKDSVRVLVNKSDIEALNEKLNIALESANNIKELSSYHHDEAKNLVKGYFDDLNNLISTLVSKEEVETIREKLENILTGVESGKNNLHNLITEGNNEVKNLIPLLSSLSTRENVQELTNNALQAVENLTARWNEQIAQNAATVNDKLENFKENLASISNLVNEISPKILEQSAQSEGRLKEELSSFSGYISEAVEKITAFEGTSSANLMSGLQETTSHISEQIKTLEEAVNASQDGIKNNLKDSLAENINQLKDFSQKLIDSITGLDNKIGAHTGEITQVVNDRYNNLEERINSLRELYSASNVENKTEILNSINSLHEITEASKSILDSNNNAYDVLLEKVSSMENAFTNGKSEILSSGMQVAGAISNQADILEAVNNSIKDLYINVADGRAVSLGNKSEIIDTINQKIFDVTSLIDGAKTQINSNLTLNKDNLAQEFAGIHSLADEIKTILQEVNENQASKQILAAILENVTEKTDTVKNLISENRDFNLEQYDGIKDITNGLKRDISDVMVILGQSQEFARNMIERVGANFAEVSNNLEQQTALLREDLANTASSQKLEVLQKIDTIDEQIKRVQSQIESFNFDESVREQLFDLKHQIESFNKESLIGVLKSVTENNQLTTDSVKDTINDVKTDFSKILSGIDLIQPKIEDAKLALSQDLEEKINNVSQELEKLSENIESNSSNNKNDIIGKIDDTAKNIEDKISQISTDIQSTASNNKSELNAGLQNIQSDLSVLKENLSGSFSENLDNVTHKLETLSENIESNSYNNKQQILDEINSLKVSSEELKNSLSEAAEGLPKESYIAAQTEQITRLVVDFSHHVQTKLLELGNADKDYIYQAVQEAFVSFEQQISDSLNYIKGVSLNLDRNFTGTKNELTAGMGSLQTSFEQFKDNFQSGLIEQKQALKEDLKNDFETFAAANKQDLISAVNANTKNLEEKIAGAAVEIQNSASGNKADLNTAVQILQSNGQTSKEEIKETLKDVSGNLAEKIEQLSGNIEANSANNKEQIINEINTLKGSSEALKSSLKDNFEALSVNNKQEIINSLDTNAKKLEEKISQVSEEIKSSVQNNEPEWQDSLQALQEDAKQVKEEIQDINTKLLQREDVALEIDRVDMALSTLSSALSAKLDEIIENDSDSAISEIQSYVSALKSDIALISGTINQTKVEIIDAFKAVNAEIENKLGSEDSRVNAFVSEVKTLLDTSFSNLSNVLVQEKIDDGEFQESLVLELRKSINEITDKLFKADEDNSAMRSELLYELQKSYNILNEKLDNQNNKTGEIKSLVDESLKTNFSEIEDMIERKYTKIQSNVIKDVAEINLEEIKAEICQDIADSAISLKEGMSEVFEHIAQNKDVLELLAKNNRDDIVSQISLIKEEIANIKTEDASLVVVPEIKRIAEKIEGISDDILDAISNDLDASFTENIRTITETVEDKISLIKDDIQEVLYKIAEVDAVVEKVKEIVTMQFEDFFDTFNLKLTMFGNDVKNLVESRTDKLTAVIEEYQKDLNSLSNIDLKEYNEDTKRFVEEQIQVLKDKIDELKNQNSAEVISDDLRETITTSSNSISKRLELLRDMILAEMPNSDEISENFDEIKAAISSVGLRTEGFAEIVRNENASLRDIIKSYQTQINALSNLEINTSGDDDTRGFIREELKQLKEQFVRSLTGVFENISFIEESEEIQNVIFDNVSEIKDEIVKLKNDIVENSNSNSDIDEKFDNLKNILESITSGTSSGDSGKYVYTLPDVEMDIAKMRMAINDITDMLKKNREDGYDVVERLDSIDDIREDISSISKRTNKLILTSDDVNKHLKENIAEFKKIMDEVSDRCNKIDSTQLNRNIVDVKALVMSGLKSDQILNEAFMHLAEWIDDSARTMNSIDSQSQNNAQNITNLKSELSNIYEKTSEISELKDAITELTVKLDKKSDIDYSKSLYEIEYGLDKLSDKLDVQELKIKSLEKKIEGLSTSQSGNEEVTSLLEFIASQVSAANENSRGNKLLLQKVEMLEKQMNQFENSISKITAFVDGAN